MSSFGKITFPLTSPQREIWFDQMMYPSVPLYNIGSWVEINIAVDSALFRQAVQYLAAGHDALRMVLQPNPVLEEPPLQTFLDEITVPLPFLDFSTEPSPEQAAEAWMQSQFIQPFALLEDKQLFRYALLKLRHEHFRFFSVYHHLISDGLGISLLHKRLGIIYAALVKERHTPFHAEWQFPAYRDFIENDQSYRHSARHSDDLTYWTEKYPSLPEPLFRLRQTHSAGRVVPSERQVLWIERGFYQRMADFASLSNSTLFHLMLAALYIYFVRTARREELAIGLPILNRSGAAFKQTVGVFINMIPARIQCGVDLNFRQLLLAIGKTLKADYRHQRLPIGDLYRELGFYASGRRNLIEVQFNYAKHDHATESGIFQGRTIALTNDSKQSPLIISVWELHQQADVQVDFVYNLAYLDASEALRIQSCFLRILEQGLDTPEIPLRSISLLSPAEQMQLIAWNPCTNTTPTTLVALFEAQAANTPNNVAVVCEVQSLTYAELNRQANQLAHCLLGMGRERLVGVCLERSLDMVIGVLAILKAGAAYVPLDPDYPKERLSFIVEDAGLRVLLTQSSLLDALPAHGTSLLCIDSGQSETYPAHNPALTIQPDDPAYVIYTSGSTGKPKGCLVTHANVTRLFAVTEDLYHFSADDVWTLFHSYSFDFSVWEIWGALLYGGKLVVVPYLTSRDPQAFYQLLRKQHVTILNQTPSAFRQLISVATQAEKLPLRYVIFGGEALDYAALSPWFKHYGTDKPRLVNMYGITETTVHVTYCPLSGDEKESGNIGRPLADLQVWILDAQQQPLPIGVAGEMYVGGNGVSRGYLNRPELSASRFLELELFGQLRRVYRTGDLARQHPDGSLEYLGRIDEQVKIRGFRIELGEIETCLAQHEAVQAAVVQPFGEGDNIRLVAYLTLRQPVVDVEHHLRAWLTERLPDYMLPGAFRVLEQFPLTVNGKIDRKALPAPDTRSRTDFVAPRTEAEKLVADIWRTILEVERIGIHDDFFAIGGNSLNGIRFINELNARTQEIFHIYDLFTASTLSQFVAGMRVHYPKLMARLEGTEIVPAAVLNREQAADLADLRRLLIKPRFKPATAPKNPPVVFVLAPPRSGTTLLRVMLGGHPAIFAPPELELLGFADLRERAARCQARDSFWLQGTVRALMELRGCDVEHAWQMMAEFEQRDLDVQAFYRELQGTAHGRLLVDKTPFYSVDTAIPSQAEAYFDKPLYIHLQRHPLGMIRSFEKARMERILSGHPYAAALADLAESTSSIRLGELLWQLCNQNILEFLAGIPRERQHALKFEELVAQPRASLEKLCTFLKLPLHEDMLNPYQDLKQRMTDGLYAEGKMLGDLKFHSHGKINAATADNWRSAYKEDFLGQATWSLAERLGYPRDVHGIPRLSEHQPKPLSFAQQRLWFLAQLEGQSATYNIPLVLRLQGKLDERALRQAFMSLLERHESLRVSFPAINGQATLRLNPVYDPLVSVELPALPPNEQQPWLDEWLVQEIHRPFDLANGPLLRVYLLTLQPEEHILLISMHHIISDGWSMGVLVKEWAQLYGAAAQQKTLHLPELPIQYSDYAAWQKTWLEQGALAAQLAYWKEKLAGLPELLELPTDFPRPAMMRHQGYHFKSRISAAIVDQLKRISREQNATLFMTLLAAFKVLLYRYSQQTDLAVGTPIANRNHQQTEGLIGLFVNTLVLRSQINPEQGFAEALRQARETALEAYSHQDVPFELLVEHLNPARSMSHAPLFQVMFMLQAMQPADLPGLDITLLEPEYKVAKFDLTLTAAEQDGGLLCTWEYDTDLFRRETIAALAEHFAVLLQSICADPQQAVAHLPLLTPAEIQQLAAPKQVSYPADQTVIAQFEARAAQHPDKVAVVFAEQQLTYAELNRRANQLAHQLMVLGVGPETLVGLCVERSLEMLIGVLGILKAGGAYLPLDPDQPQERLHFILEDAAIPILLTQSHLQAHLPITDKLRVLMLDQPAQSPGIHTNPVLRAGPDNLAYVIYTSGSTGKPKGCLVTHANISRLFTATDHWYHFDQHDTWTLFHSYAFDFSVWEIWGALLYGGKLVIVPYLTSRDPHAFYQLLLEQHVTILNQTPSAFRQLMGVDNQPEKLALRYVIFGGEALDSTLLKPWFAKHPAQPRLINMYGITETTVHVTYCPLDPPQLGGIGIPIPDLQVWILDSLRQSVPTGVPGEMYVSGAGVARGYLNRPELTASRFIEMEQFGRRDRLYRTGDLARRLTDGSLEYLGRIDNQVKLRGFRIELGEIETLLHQHQAVQEAVVLLDNNDGNPRLLAYVTVISHQLSTNSQQSAGNSDGAQTLFTDHGSLITTLRDWLKTRLPDYMVPTGFHVLAAMPLTGNGKIDRKALAALEVQTTTSAAYAPLETEHQQHMADIWAELLQLPVARIGAQDNFFDLGGHSLLATQLVSRIRSVFGIDLPLRQVFESPTVAQLSRLIAGMTQGQEDVAELEEGVL